MDGRMSLWEYGAIVHNWNERQPKDGGIPEYTGPMPSPEQEAEMRYQTAQTVARAERNKVR